MRLLYILSRQLELIINEGRPDFHSFYNSLKKENLVSDKKFREFRLIFTLNMVSYCSPRKGPGLI
jgi:hypothetical protein